MIWYDNFLKKFFHDPIDKPFNIPSHEVRAKKYAEYFGVSNIKKDDYSLSDIIASCMERSLLPKDIQQPLTEIRHPLSEEKIEVKNLESDTIIKNFETIIQKIALNYEGIDNYEQKSFLIWRNLLDEIKDKIEDKELKKLLFILPADTRIPDHSIWEHLKITTAINSFEKHQNNSLFLFTLGPVQSFISQARKTQDFFMASFILSYLTFIAILEVIKKYGPTSIIYPDLYKQPLMDWYLINKKKLTIKDFKMENTLLPTIPNRFFAIIGTSDKEEIKNFAKSIIEKIKNEIIIAINTILDKLNIKLSDNHKSILKNQLLDFPQVFWVGIPWKKGNIDLEIEDLKDFWEKENLNTWKEFFDFAKNNGEFPPNVGFLYQLIYTVVEKSIGARKNLREFEQKKETGKKCSVCGERNIIFYKNNTLRTEPLFIINNLDFFYDKKPENSFLVLNDTDITNQILGENEGLCALCFLKRTFYKYLEEKIDERVFKDFSFPSTAEIACADFKEHAIKESKEEFEQYEKRFFEILKKYDQRNQFNYLKIKSLPKIGLGKTLEGSWWYIENITEKNFLDELNIKIDKDSLVEIKELLEKLGKPNPYYAVIYLDGDNMGKWLSGEKLPEIQYAYNSEVWEKLPIDFKEELKKYSTRKILTPAIHSSISTALRNYALEFVKKIVEEEYLGKLIYAGGDDVLAFVNLKDLFDIIEKLRWSFSGQITFKNSENKDEIIVDINNTSGFVLKDNIYYLTMGKNATCSMGIVIAHYKEPLKIVIDKVFEINKKAKSNGRDKFAISLLKRSGEEKIGIAKWIIEDNLTTNILKNLKDWMNKDRTEKRYISDKFIQKFRVEFQKIKQNQIYGDAINAELKRLILRAYNGLPKESKEEKNKFLNNFSDHIIKLLWGMGGDIDNLLNLLEIASFMNKGD
jgi:CRISPR-associated protein Cmr2